jgi:hypothetical protein
MDLSASAPLRWARAGLLAAVVLMIGTAAHLSADGSLPGPVEMTALFVTSAAGGAVFLGREASTPRLVALVVGGQALVHVGLSALAGHRGDPGTGGIGHVAGHVAGHVDVTGPPRPWTGPREGSYHDLWAQQAPGGGDTASSVPAWLVHAVADVSAHPSMALMHVLAAVAVGGWLAVGERALWALISLASAGVLRVVLWLVAALSGLAGVLGESIQLATVPAAVLDPLPLRPIWSRGPVRRGPPIVLTAR